MNRRSDARLFISATHTMGTPDKSRDSAAVFDAGPNGDALIKVTVPQNLTQYDQIWITQEPDGGSPVPTAPHYLEGPLVQ